MIGDHFLEAARYLREIQDEHPDDFVSVAKNLGIGRRKAYHLAQVNRSFHALDIKVDRLRRIGWTKLALLAPHIDANNAGDWLKLAEGVTAHELKMHVRGANFDPDTRARSEEHTSELQSLMRISYAVFCLTKKKNIK